jgi:choline dehydrogenase-like flavoprotein
VGRSIGSRATVRFNGAKEPTVIGVEFQNSGDGHLFQVHARREVILCEGAINTPQTLLLSGIGAVDDLKKHEIPVVQENNAVEQNLKDHLHDCSPLQGKIRDNTRLSLKQYQGISSTIPMAHHGKRPAYKQCGRSSCVHPNSGAPHPWVPGEPSKG